jgi:GNAT superfamily N-acetyltransferase
MSRDCSFIDECNASSKDERPSLSSKMSITVRPKSSEYQQALELRDLYLRQPLGIVFTDQELAKENEAIHVVALSNNVVIGCGLGLKQGEWVKIRQMIVHPQYQNQGIGINRITDIFISIVATILGINTNAKETEPEV